MDLSRSHAGAARTVHVVAIPYPGRGHINPMMNLCKLLASMAPDILITFVVTEEWLGVVGSEPKPDAVRFASIPNVIPSERVRAENFPGFLEAVMTKMEAPVEQLLDRLEPPVTTILADTYLFWAVRIGNKRKIPVGSFWTMAVSVFSVFHHFDLLVQNNHFPIDLAERGDELVDYIPGLSPTRLVDLPTFFEGRGRVTVGRALEGFSWMPKAQYIISTAFYELEPHAIDALKAELSLPIYTVGPLIPYLELEDKSSVSASRDDRPDYFRWLDSQPEASVLYISLGSFLSVSKEQMEELAAGVRSSGVRFLWVSRDGGSWVEDSVCGDRGLVVPWCDQLKVLNHSAVGGFWTHCGYNSILEAVFASIPMLAFPIFWDQIPNCKLVEQDWKIGWRVKKTRAELVSRQAISEILQRFMDLDSEDGKAIRKRASELRQACGQAILKGGSSYSDINAFIGDIFKKITC
ncbi:hypothetical protein BT93_L0570 [Corymbia citriodora subsp. variegata]|uniref:Uncharacterized protein n=1 Tax=Corymbia citriodora subsp. variegata TaxID=360336 RepID=A0A8T0CPP7_CORYI|nr:hypothetical protein BT93_L0570 [Corymbia citriodora subsp. variegata]